MTKRIQLQLQLQQHILTMVNEIALLLRVHFLFSRSTSPWPGFDKRSSFIIVNIIFVKAYNSLACSSIGWIQGSLRNENLRWKPSDYVLFGTSFRRAVPAGQVLIFTFYHILIVCMYLRCYISNCSLAILDPSKPEGCRGFARQGALKAITIIRSREAGGYVNKFPMRLEYIHIHLHT